jgi:hypothetical protein
MGKSLIHFTTAVRQTALCAVCFLATFVPLLHAQHLRISSPTHQARLPEVVEVNLTEARRHIPDIDHMAAEDATTHRRLSAQIFTSPDKTTPDLLLIAVEIPQTGNIRVNFVPAPQPDSTPPLVFGREAPERKDDFAWENQFVTYRVYGPALEATGEITSGIDVWSKRVPNLVIDRFYKHDAEGTRTHNPALSYHKDDGVGLDSYLVGPSRGCGGTGVLSGGKLWVSNNYTHLKTIATGPVRFEFELTYAPWNADGVQVTETKSITLDAGSRLNKIQSTFTFASPTPAPATIQAAAGIAIHPGADYEELDHGPILSVWDTPQDPTAGRIATGILAAPGEQAKAVNLDSQGLLTIPLQSGQSFTYYAGSAWSKADMPTQQAWDNYLRQLKAQLQQPLQIRWEK